MRTLPFFFGLLLIQFYKLARFTILCNCGLLQDTLVNVFRHPWYSGYSDYVGLIDPYGLPWMVFYSLISANLFVAIAGLVTVDTGFLAVMKNRLSVHAFLLILGMDFLVFYTAPVDILIFWLLALGIFYSPVLSLLALYTKIPLWPAPAYYLTYVINGPVSHLTIMGSWRYFLFLIMFILGWLGPVRDWLGH